MASERAGGRVGGRFEAILLALTIVGMAVGLWVVGSRGWLPSLASRHGAGIDRMMIYLLVVTGSLVLIGHVVLGWFIWRFTRQDKISHRLATPKTERNWSLLVAAVMMVVAEGGVLAIGLPVWDEYFASAPPADALPVEILAEQFAWNIRYPGADGKFGRTDTALMDATNPIGLDKSDPAATDDVLSINQMALPVDRPVRITLKSKDVLHSFFLPHFRVKQDAVPGMAIEIWFVPTVEGQFEIACAELCGLAHYRMRGLLNVVSNDGFESWLVEKQGEM